MPYRIEISSKIPDTRALVRKRKLEEDGFKGKIKSVFLVDVYAIDKKITPPQAQKVTGMLMNSIVQTAQINRPVSPKTFDFAIEIGYLPGVTDNIATTTKELTEDVLKLKFKNGENIYTSQITFIAGTVNEKEAKEIANSLYNPLIQRATIKSPTQFRNDKGMGATVPKVTLHETQKIDLVNLDVSDEELVIIGKKGIENADGTRRGPLALDLSYMKAIQKYFKKIGRNPTDIELESIAQTWSEHCKHTIFADPIDDIKDGLFNTYIKAATEKIREQKGKKDFCVSVFKDNSGAIKFDETYLITDKVETHNSPSALDPFGGAITGIVGVNRDAIGFGLGAKPIINRYGFCFAEPEDTKPLYKGPDFTQKMLEPIRIITGVIEGVNVGGNCSGIPTPQGFMYFNKRYKGKPLVFVGTVGLIPKKDFRKKAQSGDYIVMIGGKVGQDGIHGATFSSEAMDLGSPATAVQIGDPITQKKLSDAITKEARDLGLYHSITDNGAGGLSCSVAEMAKECGGCQVKLDSVPLKYPGLSPWQIWISESQERMTLAVPKRKWKQFNDLMKKRGVEATVIGAFTRSGRCVVTFHNKKIMDVEMKFLHDGLPERPMKTLSKKIQFSHYSISQPENLITILHQMLQRFNIAGFEFLSMQYDHEVQAGSVMKPLQGKRRINGEATITRPVLSSKKGVVLSQGLYPSYSEIDSYSMAACSIDSAIRNAVAAGANPDHLALLDNFCWCSPDDPERLGQLKNATKACYDYATAFGTPFISGKDSMFNDFKGYDEKGNPVKISVPPTLLISSIGVIDDVEKSVSIDPKFSGDLIYILGEIYEELGGSEYFSFQSVQGGEVPQVNAKKNINLYRLLFQAMQQGLIASAISVTRGGLGIALAKMAMAGELGIDISLKDLPGKKIRDDFALFSESQGRIILTINPKNKSKFEKIMKKNSFSLIGKVTDSKFLTIMGKNGKQVIKTEITELLKSYKLTFKNY